MFGVGETELVIIVVFAFLLFGPDKLPGMGRTIGRALRQFRTAQEDFTQVVQAEVVDPMTSAMSEPGKKHRSGVDAAGDDADIEGAAGESRGATGETFAERKARLKAEREAREAAAAEAQEAAAAAGDEPGDLPAGEGSVAGAAEGAEPAAGAEAAEATTTADAPIEESPTSAAALYAMAPRKRPRPAEADQDAAGDAEAAAAPETSEDQAAPDAAQTLRAPEGTAGPSDDSPAQPAPSQGEEEAASAEPAVVEAEGKEEGAGA